MFIDENFKRRCSFTQIPDAFRIIIHLESVRNSLLLCLHSFVTGVKT